MKKLLSILGTIILVTAGTTNLISCKNNKITTAKEKKVEDDFDEMSKIKQKINDKLQNFERKSFTIDTSSPEMEATFKPLYDRALSEESKEFEKDKENSNALAYFKNDLYKEIATLNKSIKNDYSNVYSDFTNPITMTKEIFSINNINIKDAAHKLGLPSIPPNIRMIKVQYSFKYILKYKKLEHNESGLIRYIITNDVEKTTAITNQVITKIRPVLEKIQDNPIDIWNHSSFKKTKDSRDFFLNATEISIPEEFKIFLLEEFRKDGDLKNIVKDIKFNETYRLLRFKSSNMKNSMIKSKPNPDQGLKKWTSRPLGELQVDDFTDMFKQTNIKFKDSDDPFIELGSGEFRISNIEVFGIPIILKELNDNKPLKMKFVIQRSEFYNMIHTFGDILIKFLKYYNYNYNDMITFGSTNGIDWDYVVPSYTIPKKLKEKIMELLPTTGANRGINNFFKLLVDNFKQSEVAKKINSEYLALFSVQNDFHQSDIGHITIDGSVIECLPMDEKVKIELERLEGKKEENLVLHGGGGDWNWAFYFGKNVKTALSYVKYSINLESCKPLYFWFDDK